MRLSVPTVALLFLLALQAPAYAYLDPGTGSMIVQAIIGGAAVAAATVSAYWGRIRSLVPFLRRREGHPDK